MRCLELLSRARDPRAGCESGSGPREPWGANRQDHDPVRARLRKLNPAWVVVFGDVNSTVACALVAAKLGTAVAHVEAGLRSNDWSMPEEINRLVTDRLSTRLYAPSQDACDNLMREGISPERVRLVGNIMVDTLLARLPKIDQERTLSEFGVERQRFVLVTLHRPSNVDDSNRLLQVCSVLGRASEREAVLFPAHPRTQARLQERTLKDALGRTRVISPLPYHAFLALMAGARAVVTDSGGIQEETTALGFRVSRYAPTPSAP